MRPFAGEGDFYRRYRFYPYAIDQAAVHDHAVYRLVFEYAPTREAFDWLAAVVEMIDFAANVVWAGPFAACLLPRHDDRARELFVAVDRVWPLREVACLSAPQSLRSAWPHDHATDKPRPPTPGPWVEYVTENHALAFPLETTCAWRHDERFEAARKRPRVQLGDSWHQWPRGLPPYLPVTSAIAIVDVERPARPSNDARGRWLAYEPGHGDRVLLGHGTGLVCQADGDLGVILDELTFPVEVGDPAPLRSVALSPSATHVVYVTETGTAAWLLDLDRLTSIAVAWPDPPDSCVDVAWVDDSSFVVLMAGGRGELVLCGDSELGVVHRLLAVPCRGDRVWVAGGPYAITSGATGCQIYAVGDRALVEIASFDDIVVIDVVDHDGTVVLITEAAAYALGGLEPARQRALYPRFSLAGECGPVPARPATGVDERGDRWYRSSHGFEVIVRGGVLHDRRTGAPVVAEDGTAIRGDDLRVWPEWHGHVAFDGATVWRIGSTGARRLAEANRVDHLATSGDHALIVAGDTLAVVGTAGTLAQLPCPAIDYVVDACVTILIQLAGRLAILQLDRGALSWCAVWPAALPHPDAAWYFEWETYVQCGGDEPRWFRLRYMTSGEPVTDLRSIPSSVPEVSLQ